MEDSDGGLGWRTRMEDSDGGLGLARGPGPRAGGGLRLHGRAVQVRGRNAGNAARGEGTVRVGARGAPHRVRRRPAARPRGRRLGLGGRPRPPVFRSPRGAAVGSAASAISMLSTLVRRVFSSATLPHTFRQTHRRWKRRFRAFFASAGRRHPCPDQLIRVQTGAGMLLCVILLRRLRGESGDGSCAAS
jgi:hypothetical protein